MNFNVKCTDSTEHKKPNDEYSSDEDNLACDNSLVVDTIETIEEHDATMATPHPVNSIDSS
ncbi:hypothetical protein scyTo_0025257, partial [Scyliorhinus torazame]|nr:hypothetical protein [Scyliorhinus torazame]